MKVIEDGFLIADIPHYRWDGGLWTLWAIELRPKRPVGLYRPILRAWRSLGQLHLDLGYKTITLSRMRPFVGAEPNKLIEEV